MDDYLPVRANLTIPVWVDADLGVHDDGTVSIVTFIDTDEDNTIEVNTPFDEVISDLIDHWTTGSPDESISVLSTLACALRDASERCYDAVDELEGYRVEHEAEQFPVL